MEIVTKVMEKSWKFVGKKCVRTLMFIIRSSYHMLYLLILNNFASMNNAVTQIVH